MSVSSPIPGSGNPNSADHSSSTNRSSTQHSSSAQDQAPEHPTGNSTATDTTSDVAAEVAAVNEAFPRARAAQERWARVPVARRARIIKRVGRAVLRHRHQLVRSVVAETGKVQADATAEVVDVASTAFFYARSARRVLAPRRVGGAIPGLTSAWVTRVPVGVVGVVAPWNYPLSLVLSDALPALVAGNAVVVKPDVQTEATALLAQEIVSQAGVPAGLFEVVCGPGPSVGQAVVGQADFVMFTGSTATGRLLASQAGERLVGFSGELGGKNPMIVAPCGDLRRAARGAVDACFSNAGQLCVAVERICVVDGPTAPTTGGGPGAKASASSRAKASAQPGAREREFTRLFVEEIAARGDIGLLISSTHGDRVRGFIDDAVQCGLEVVCGGTVQGRRAQPTVLRVPAVSRSDHPARLVREEVFGPVVTVTSAPTVADAVRWANDSEYGLNASVWASPAVGRHIAEQLRAGTVNINEGYAAAWGSVGGPMGGMGASGVGRRHGVEGLVKFTEARTIASQRVLPVGVLLRRGWLAAAAVWLLGLLP